tara:strand:- start:7406 stop:20074 length:12669 start_codon:yes stop_codon:yes gene_type:complete
MDRKEAIRDKLKQLSPEQRAAVLEKIVHRKREAAKNELNQSYHLSQAQRRIWLASQISAQANAAYNISAAYSFHGGLDLVRLNRAWRLLLDTHEVLRSVISQQGDQLFQRPRDSNTWEITQRQLSGSKNFEKEVRSLAQSESAIPMDLGRDWLIRVIGCTTKTPKQEKAKSEKFGLIIIIHHIVCDGISIGRMISDLCKFYDLDSSDQRRYLPSLQYRNFVNADPLSNLSKERIYWKSILSSEPESLDALIDLQREKNQNFSGSSFSFSLGQSELSAFEDLCNKQNCTLFMGVVSVTQILLARFADVSEVAIGTPVSGRSDSKQNDIVGPFINTIVLRQTINRKESFLQYLALVKGTVIDGFEHQNLALEDLVSDLSISSYANRPPLFSAMLGLNYAEETELKFGTSLGEEIRIPTTHSKVDITFHLEKNLSNGLSIEIEYATSLFSAATIKRLAEAWEILFQSVVQRPELPVGDYPLISEADKRWLLEDVNNTGQEYPGKSSIVTEFRRIVHESPDATAIHSGEMCVSYQELDDLSEYVARRLAAQEKHSLGCRIGIMLEKDYRAIVAILGILKSGGIYVPLATNTPIERVKFILESGNVKLLLAETNTALGSKNCDCAIISIDSILLDKLSEEQDGNILTAKDELHASKLPDVETLKAECALAYIMFTSGSTGMPKGTLIEQRSILRLVCDTDYHQVESGERVLLSGSLAFDAATFEIWGPLLNGGCVCIPPEQQLLEVQEFEKLVEYYQIDTAFLTTGLFNQIVSNKVEALARLRTVLTGGEKISVEHAKMLLEKYPSKKLLHVYGPTENTTFSTWHQVSKKDLNGITIPIGRPIANSRIYLLDSNQLLVPIGVPGEIYCAGDGVASGYIESFEDKVPFSEDKFRPSPGNRLYRTGDKAKWNQHGELVFLGRIDRQVKIRGFRIELGEVEHHIRGLDEIDDAYVIAQGEAGTNELIAYIASRTLDTIDTSTLRSALQGIVAGYMMPAKTILLKKFPLNSNGKIDVKALPKPGETQSFVARCGRLVGEEEEVLGELYAQVLGLDDAAARAIDRDNNFFTAGGDSIRAIQLIALAKGKGYRLSIANIFASETLSELAILMEKTSIAVVDAVLDKAPLSPTQLWWLDQEGMPADHFNLSSIFSVSLDVDIASLRATLDELLTIHPALRLRIDLDEQVQCLNTKGAYSLSVIKESELGSNKSRRNFLSKLHENISLESGVLLAIGLIAGEKLSSLAIVAHHLVADEVSGRLLTENLERLYKKHSLEAQGHSTESIPLPLQESTAITNWACALQGLVRSNHFDGDISYWERTVTQGKDILLNQESLFKAHKNQRSEVNSKLTSSESKELLKLSKKLLRASTQEILLGSFINAFRRESGFDDCLMSLEGHGRESYAELADCESTIGWFTSIYPFTYNSKNKSDVQVYREIKDCLRGVPAKGFSFLPLRFYGSSEVNESLSIKPEISFNYLGESARDEQSSWLNSEREEVGCDHGIQVVEPFKLDVLASVRDGCIELMLKGLDLSDSVSIQGLNDGWLAELKNLLNWLRDIENSIVAGKLTPHPSLLSASDCVANFSSLSELDRALSEIPLPPLSVEEVMPLTGVQSGMLMHCSFDDEAYQDQVSLRLHQAIDSAKFESAVKALVAETAALRTGFLQSSSGEALQLVFRSREGFYNFIDGQSWDSEIEIELDRLRIDLRDQKVDLLNDSLFRLTLVRLGPDLFDLIIDFHHIAIDGWSSSLLLKRLEEFYFEEAQFGDQGAVRSMKHYFQWLQQQPTLESRKYWQSLIGDYEGRVEVPSSVPRTSTDKFEPIFSEAYLGPKQFDRVNAWCKRHGVTINSFVQSLWGIALGQFTGSNDIVYGATVSGRDGEITGIESMVGMLINTLPVRIRVGIHESFSELVKETGRQFANSMIHGHVSLAEIQTLTPARGGLITHTLVFENYASATSDDSKWQWETIDIFDPMHFEFGIIVTPLENDLSLRFVANKSLYCAGYLEKISATFLKLTKEAIGDDFKTDKYPNQSSVGSCRTWTISANFTADSLVSKLQFHEHISGRSNQVSILPYDQIVQELINPQSTLRTYEEVNHVILWRPYLVDDELQEEESIEQFEEIVSAIASYAELFVGSQLMLVRCPILALVSGFDDRINLKAASYLAHLTNVSVLDLETLTTDYSLKDPCYSADMLFGNIPYTEGFFASLATKLTRHYDLISRKPVKVFAVDADETLWGGIVGEDGVNGIRIEEEHIALQEKLLEARSAGALLCLVTKNNSSDIEDAFENRDMPIKIEHFSRVCASWDPKSESINQLSEDLSLGLESFVFIDDNPLECDEVLIGCPGIKVIQLPAQAKRGSFLRHMWLLDSQAKTEEDKRRVQMYTEELERSSAKKTIGDYSKFLASLQVQIDTAAMAQSDIVRIAQLSDRTNQFNSSGVRFSDSQLNSLLTHPTQHVRRVIVSDKYGDYGLVGSILIEQSADIWVVPSFMLSCRVLGRGVEHSIIRKLAQEAKAVGARKLVIEYTKLPRNSPVLGFLQSLSGIDMSFSGDVQHFTIDLKAADTFGSDEGESASNSKISDQANSESDENASDSQMDAHLMASQISNYYAYLSYNMGVESDILHEVTARFGVQRRAKTPSRDNESLRTKTGLNSAIEEKIGFFFSELLETSVQHSEQDFYDLGGHSLKAVMLLSRIYSEFKIRMELHDVQENSTIHALSARIQNELDCRCDANSKEEFPELEKIPNAPDYLLAPGQSRLWMLERLRGDGPSPFLMHATIEVENELDRCALNDAFRGVLDKHSALRSCFVQTNQGAVRQKVVELECIDAEVTWLAGLIEDDSLINYSRAETRKPFDLSAAPLVRLSGGLLKSGKTVLFITMHHIVSDGWSIGIFSRELTKNYAQATNSSGTKVVETSNLGALEYSDYADWHRRWLVSEAGKRSANFWVQHFEIPIEALDLPVLSSRPKVKQSKGKSVSIDIDQKTWAQYKDLLCDSGMSEFAGLFSVLQLVLARLSGQSNFSIGTAVAGRNQQTLENIVGFFVNVLPLRSTLGMTQSVDEFLEAAANEVNACLEHQNVPFETIVSNLDISRDPSRSPLFDVLLVLQNTQVEAIKFGDTESAVKALDSETSQYDLTINAFSDSNGELRLIAEYDCVIYSAENIELLLRSVYQCLKMLPISRSSLLSEVPWFPSHDLALVESFEGKPFDSTPELLHAIVGRIANSAKGKIVDMESSWSYSKLVSEIERIANLIDFRFHEHGLPLTPLDRQIHVGVIGERSVKSVAAMLGVMKAGAVYIPLDLSSPLDRLQSIVREGAIQIVLSTDQSGKEVVDSMLADQTEVLHVIYDERANGLVNVDRKLRVSDVAYIIFTSGSTGTPKGVEITHAAFSAMIEQQIEAFDVKSDDVCAQFASLSFDASLSEIFLALGTGGSLVIASDHLKSDIDRFLGWLRDNAISVITLPPAFLRAVNRRTLAKVRVLITAGETAIGEDLSHYAKRLHVINAYGPTEASVCATSYVVNDRDDWSFGVPIGKPMPGVRVAVRDEFGKRVPVGVQGELLIGGSTVGLGYFAAKELTAEKFDAKLDDSIGVRWYATGDKVRWRHDSMLEYIGRYDDQLKIRGYRIEPREIEYAFRQIEGVIDAALLVDEKAGLIVFCSGESWNSQDQQRLKSEVRKTLPRYMIPGDVVLLADIPRTVAGKIDRKSLLSLTSKPEIKYSPPETPSEKALALAWGKALGVEHVGKFDDFFSLGGDSIKALQVLSELKSSGYTGELAKFFAFPSLEDAASYLEAEVNSTSFREPLSGLVSLLPTQDWFLNSRNVKAAAHFHIVIELDVTVPLTNLMLERILASLIVNHDSLRARFLFENATWKQDIRTKMNVDDVLLQYQRSASLSKEVEDKAVEELACQPFDLQGSHLFRVVAIKGESGVCESLVIAIHHLLCDWVSVRLLVQDMNTLANNELYSTESNLNSISPPHLLSAISRQRSETVKSDNKEVSKLLGRASVIADSINKTPSSHSQLRTLHLTIDERKLRVLRGYLATLSLELETELDIQDLVLATSLRSLNDLLGTKEIPIIVEGHGREEQIIDEEGVRFDLSQQIGWLTRARLMMIDRNDSEENGLLCHVHACLDRVKREDIDVFSAVMSNIEPVASVLPGLISFNNLGEFQNNRNNGDIFNLTDRVFKKAVAGDSPADIPLAIEFYIIDDSLKIQIAWSECLFSSIIIEERLKLIHQELLTIVKENSLAG